MIKGEFEGAVVAESIRFSHGDFGLVVQPLHDAAGKQCLRPEIVQDEFTVVAERPGDLLHGFDARAHGLAAPLVEELAGPGGRIVLPESLKGFLEKVSADSLEIVAEEIA